VSGVSSAGRRAAINATSIAATQKMSCSFSLA
jgi:hypothetical protein